MHSHIFFTIVNILHLNLLNIDNFRTTAIDLRCAEEFKIESFLAIGLAVAFTGAAAVSAAKPVTIGVQACFSGADTDQGKTSSNTI